MKSFSYWNKCFREQRLLEFSTDKSALLWLKIKSIARKNIITKFASEHSVTLKTKKIDAQFNELFSALSSNVAGSHRLLDLFIQKFAGSELKNLDTKAIESNLYKVRSFEWGGGYRNSLDKFFVSRYVKTHKIIPYDKLVSEFDNGIKKSASSYVVNSWYNYWSSVMTEWIFKTHKRVLPTIGKIKNVDFFISDIPFDLKVTYLPKEYIWLISKKLKIPIELSFLKSFAKTHEIDFDDEAQGEQCLYEITEKLRNKNDKDCQAALATAGKNRKRLIDHATQHKGELIKWLYENQGEMRFGAENRIFVLLANSENFEESWKLKRNMNQLKPTINRYLRNFSSKNLDLMKIKFKYKGQVYSTFADLIFVVK